MWPDLPAACVVALWHRHAPSLLVAFAKRHPSARSTIMIFRDARGDMLARLCQMLGFVVIRGGTNGGWAALTELTHELEKRACAFITADGGGPMRVAKVGAVALAAAAVVPLVPLAADCSPAIEERHKWEAARNPLPLSHIGMIGRWTLPISMIARSSHIRASSISATSMSAGNERGCPIAIDITASHLATEPLPQS